MKLIKLFESEDQDIDWDEISSRIKNDCKPWLSMHSSVRLYRGMHEDEPFIEKKVRLNGRQSSDTNPMIHRSLNKASQNVYGKPYRNSLFVTMFKQQAASYGEIYIIFPIGKIDYLSSPTIDDLYDYVQISDTKISKKLGEITRTSQNKEGDMVTVLEEMFKNDFNENSDITKAKGEIMIRCDRYYAIEAEKIVKLKL